MPETEQPTATSKARQKNFENYSFRGRRPNEKVALVVRYHPWLLMPIVFWWLVAALLIGLTLRFFGASAITSVVIAVLVLAAIIKSLYAWFLWNGGNYIITNQRVIRTDQIGLFKRQISEAEIDRIQEISTRISGPIKTMFNFGTVRIRTTTSSGNVDLQNVADPYDIQQVIARLQQQTAREAQQPKPNRVG